MSNQEAPLSGNFKIGNFQQTVRGNNLSEYVLELMPFASHPDVAQVLAVIDGKQHEQAVNTVQTVFPGSTVIESTQLTPVAPAQPFAPVAPPATAAPATPTGPVCKHGAMTHRTGTNKTNGSPWSGWFCPSPKGTADQCSPQFSK